MLVPICYRVDSIAQQVKAKKKMEKNGKRFQRWSRLDNKLNLKCAFNFIWRPEALFNSTQRNVMF